MKVVEQRIMRGPNYWSVKHPKIIVLKVDLGNVAEVKTNEIPGFADRLEAWFPGMYKHRSTEDIDGGFFKKVREGTDLSKVIQHVALELQTMAGMDSGYGRSCPAEEPGTYTVIFSYQEEQAGEYAANAAIRVTRALVANEHYDVQKEVAELHEIRESAHFGPSTQSIVDEAVSRGIPYLTIPDTSIIQLGYGVNQKRIQGTLTCSTGMFAVEIAGDKDLTKRMLHDSGVPVPHGVIIYDEKELDDAIEKVGYPLVTKPLDSHQGKGASININQYKDALTGFKEAQKYSKAVIVERFIAGYDYRLLVINGKFVAAAKRTPAAVTGNGISTIRELIEEVNKDPRRGVGHEKELTMIHIDKDTEMILENKGLTLDSVIPAGEELFLKTTANLSTGGTAMDVTDLCDEYNILMAERIAGIIGLNVCGIDVMTTDIAIPLNEAGGAVIEVNAAPGFRMHISPTEGLARNVAEPVIDMLFPATCKPSIPIVAITGTNGKTTTSRLIAHMVKYMGYRVGFTTTDGIYIQEKRLVKGDTTGPVSTEFVLRDPTVNFAVLECARGGMLRSGLGFRTCDVGIVTNVAADHLGLGGINTVEDMAKVKSVIPRTVHKDGYAVLNADDDHTYKMADGLDCKVAFFSLDEENPRILEHIAKGGLAAVYENGYISIYKNTYKIRIDRAADIPLTFGGRALFNIQNVLAAVLAGYVSKFDIDDIKMALRTFIPSASKTPGRMNLFQFPNFEVLVDYAHNAAGLRAVGEFLKRTDATTKIGVIAGIGDRRDEDTRELGRLAAEFFDEIIIRHDRDLRGRTGEELNTLIKEGIEEVDPNKKVFEISNEMRAIAFSLEHAKRGSFVSIFTDDVSEAIKMVENFKTIQDRRVLVD
ncbi:cyanophycin synthetase [Adhaeribacter soli]|uniref:Cyanophycin synthetase n=1 Tax=Adhaeribacter soli TaxID=2607655 RepID=A0A5N1J5K5_9BACT|nr:cyanophycin synthetase [Adhaeribacter soli]KAA9345984.1 cyanophycin synthetase [Adhaeribacter soli]